MSPYRRWWVVVAAVAVTSAGCKAKVDASLDVYNSWVAHSQAIARLFNDLANIVNGNPVQGAAVINKRQQVPESRIAEFETQVNGFTIPDRSKVDPRLAEAIDQYTANALGLAKRLRAYNAAIRSDPTGVAVNAEVEKINTELNQFNLQASQIEQVMEQVAKDAGRTLTRKN